MRPGYIVVRCDKCREEFERYRAHPYIVQCPSCRKGESMTQAELNKTRIGKPVNAWCAPEDLQDRYTSEGLIG